MKILVYNQQDDLPINSSSVEPIAREIIRGEGQDTDEVSVHFVTTPTMISLHNTFFQKEKTTDCISLPIDSGKEPSSTYHLLGEVFICPQTAIEYTAQKAPSADPYRETLLYLIHSLLHLLGYRDTLPEERREMRQAEKKYLSLLQDKNLTLEPLVYTHS